MYKANVKQLGPILALLALMAIAAYFVVVETKAFLQIAKWAVFVPVVLVGAVIAIAVVLFALSVVWTILMLIVRSIAYNIGVGYAQGITEVAKQEVEKASQRNLESILKTMEENSFFKRYK